MLSNIKLYLYGAAILAVVGLYIFSVTKAYHLGENTVTVEVQKAVLAEKSREEDANQQAQDASDLKIKELEKNNQTLQDEREKLLDEAKKDVNADKPCLSAPSVQRLKGKPGSKAASKPSTGKAGHWVHWPHGFTK